MKMNALSVFILTIMILFPRELYGQSDNSSDDLGFIIFENYSRGDEDLIVEALQNFQNKSLALEILAVMDDVNKWDESEMPLTVCFFKGNRNARQKIKALAEEWQIAGSYIQFDFGNRRSLENCNNTYFDIRISFDRPGVESEIGVKSKEIVTYRPTMNLGGFDKKDVIGDQEFRRWVLHEFGHAIGLLHEHQGPLANCDNEYDIPKITQYLKGPDYGWSDDKIQTNLYSLSLDRPRTNFFDLASIMIYSFKPEFYLGGEENRCFSEGNFNLSQGDKSFVSSEFDINNTKALESEKAIMEKLKSELLRMYRTGNFSEEAISSYLDNENLNFGTQ